MPGKPELAIKKKTIMKENIGINCATPKLSFINLEWECLYIIPIQKNNAAEISPWDIIWTMAPSRPIAAAVGLFPIRLKTRNMPIVTKPI